MALKAQLHNGQNVRLHGAFNRFDLRSVFRDPLHLPVEPILHPINCLSVNHILNGQKKQYCQNWCSNTWVRARMAHVCYLLIFFYYHLFLFRVWVKGGVDKYCAFNLSIMPDSDLWPRLYAACHWLRTYRSVTLRRYRTLVKRSFLKACPSMPLGALWMEPSIAQG